MIIGDVTNENSRRRSQGRCLGESSKERTWSRRFLKRKTRGLFLGLLVSVGLYCLPWLTTELRAHGVSESGVLVTEGPASTEIDMTVSAAVPEPSRDAARSVVNQMKVWRSGAKVHV